MLKKTLPKSNLPSKSEFNSNNINKYLNEYDDNEDNYDENIINKDDLLFERIKTSVHSKYPNITDEKFYKKINKIYNKYKFKTDNRSFDEICNPKKYKLQLPQQFLSEFINPKTPYMGCMVYHQIGSGKTCTAVRIAEKWKKYKRLIIVTPASLTGNFRNELRSMCADDNYLKQSERIELSKLHPSSDKYKEIIKKSNARINEYYEIYSHNKFVDLLNQNKINLKNALLIIDEIQNMVSEFGSFYDTLYNAIHSAPKDLRIVLLSATPMFDKSNEIALTMNLLRLPKELPVGKKFDKMFIKVHKKTNGSYTYNVKNMDTFKKYVKGYVSYFRGAKPDVFPSTKVKYVECEMSDFQFNAYQKLLKNEETNVFLTKAQKKKILKDPNVTNLPNNFYIGTRIISNIVFPNKKINETGFNSLTTNQIKKNLSTYSCKLYEIINKVESCRGKIFIYSNFKEYGGIKSIVKVLEAYGYSNYLTHGEGKKRFAIWDGDVKINIKDEIRNVFNSKKNIKGTKLKILIGSPASNAGLSLLNIRQIHIMDPYWNQSKIDQIMGRGNRYCSHKDLLEHQRTLKIFIYIAIAPLHATKDEPFETVDQFIKKIASKKNNIIKKFETAIKEVAIDCTLNKKANVFAGEDDIKCDS